MHEALIERFLDASVPCITTKALFNLDRPFAAQLIIVCQNVHDIAEKKGFPSPLILGVSDLAESDDNIMGVQCARNPNGVHVLHVCNNRATCKYCGEQFFVEV